MPRSPIIERIGSISNLPSLPTVAMEILQLTRREEVAIPELARLVQMDPALTAKILKTVNSPLFGLRRKISALPQAMVVLGLRAVKMMVLSFSLVDALDSDRSSGFDYTSYWRRSLLSATSAYLISKAAGPRCADEAFVGGLLSDVGMVAAWRCAQDAYRLVLERAAAEGKPLVEVELEQLGTTHAAVSRELLGRWGLPEILCEAVGAHHGEDLNGLAGDDLACARFVRCGAAIAGVFCHDVPCLEVERIRRDCSALAGIDEPALDGILKELERRVQDTASLLSVEVGEVMGYADLQEQAAAQLVQLSLQAETERAAASNSARLAEQQAEQLREENEIIREAAATDRLTNIANRRAFDACLAERIERLQTPGRSLGLILMDLDHFKRVNDTFGHPAGDAVLQAVGARLREVVSESGFVARYGGEEFAVLLVDRTAQELHQLAEEIRRAIQGRGIEHEGRTLRVTASLGGAWVEAGRPRNGAKRLVQRADECLYRAKHGGRDCVRTAKVPPLP